MKTRLQFALVFVLVIAAFVFIRSVVADAQTPRAPQRIVWEYKDAANLNSVQLNALGAEGWELAGMTTFESQIYYVFKRAK